MLEFRVLRYFLAIAREGNITRAANTLHVTQPTLSRQIQELEDRLGHKLFIRSSHSVALTEEGILLRKRAEEILDLVGKTEAEFDNYQSEIAGDVYIGGGETVAISFVADVINELMTAYPKMHFHLYSGNASDVTYRLDRGLIDFGILIEPADISKYDCVRLPSSDRWGVVMRKDSPLAHKSFIEKADLIGLPLIMSRQAIDAKEDNNFIKWFGDDFEKLNIIATFNLLFNAAMLVKSGGGYIVSIDNIINTGADSDLCFVPLKPELNSGLVLVWKKYQVFSPAALTFLQTLKNRL